MQKRKPRVVEWNSCIDVPLVRGVLGTYRFARFLLAPHAAPAAYRSAFERRVGPRKWDL